MSPRKQSRIPLACPSHQEGTCLVCIQNPTALASVCPPAWSECEKNWKTKAPRPRALPAEVWGRQARGGRLRGREGGVAAATAPEHKNNEARGAMGLSRLVPESLSDLDRCHSWAPGEAPQPQCCRTPLSHCHLPHPTATSPRPGRWRFRQAQPQETTPPGGSGGGPPRGREGSNGVS